MTTDAVSRLRRCMIEDMNSRKLGMHTREPHLQLQALRCVSEAIP